MHVLLSADSSVAIYEQIKDQMRAAILSGTIAAGHALPSLRQLAAELRVSIVTVTRAYNDLVAEGLVKNEHGRGFVVLEVDAATATSALEARVDEVLRALVVAARHARLNPADVHNRFDEIWRTHD